MRSRTRTITVVSSAGAILAAAAFPASAALAGPASYAGQSQASVVELRLNLPALAPGLPSLGPVTPGQPILLGLISSDGSTSHAPGRADAGAATAQLASGTLTTAPGPLAPANRTATADLAHPGPVNSSLGALPSSVPAVSLSGGELRAQASQAPLGVASAGALASLSLGKLTELLPPGTLTPLTNALNSGAGTASSTLTSAVNQALGAVTGALKSTPAGSPVNPTLTTLQQQLDRLLAQVPGLLNQIENGSVVSLQGLTSSQDVAEVAGRETATAAASLADLSLLGGFITLRGFQNSVTASTDGTSGAATPVPDVAQVQVGQGLLGLDLGPNGLLGSVAGTELPAPVSGAVQQVVSALNAVINKAGVSIVPASYTKSVSPDGRTATATSSGLTIMVNSPADAGNTDPQKALLLVRIGAASATAQAAPPAPVSLSAGAAAPRALAFTGADLPLTGGIALMAVAAGVLLRRRGTV